MRKSLVLLLFIISSISFAQKNIPKFVLWNVGEPTYTFHAYQLALSYERMFLEHQSIVLDGSYFVNNAVGIPSDGLYESARYSGSFSYRFYSKKENSILKYSFIGPGLKYQNQIYSSENRSIKNYKSEFYGLGLYFGKSFNKHKPKYLQVDLGFGISYGIRKYYSYYHKYHNYDNELIIKNELPKDSYTVVPEFIFRLGFPF